ncbi:MAG TPA: Si-specific NAD(P)(+) transhydrogenase [Planctomycetota bacterium]|nr:Si-specific NAD(P)(+) transhydrogenase [Planctomycetota bacterium]
MPNASDTYDLVVIGSGPAGSSGALSASFFGKRVALIERAKAVGGAGINTGTIPSKALRESALMLSGSRARKLLGVNVSLKHETTIAELAYLSEHVQHALRVQTEVRLHNRHAKLVRGDGSFVDSHTIQVKDPDGSVKQLRGERILIATGSSPVRPPEFPFEHPRVHDFDEILDIKELPKRLAVVGAGVIGAEYACTFAALGVEVHLIDGRDSLLPFLDQDISVAISTAMKRNGVHFHWKERVVSCVAPPAGEVQLTLSSGVTLGFTDVLVASGRCSNTESLNLAAAGIEPGKRGLVPVNEWFQTVVPHIYAAGDAVGPPALAATGMEQARVAVCHAFDLIKKTNAAVLPTGIYTIPEASMAGLTEQAVKESGVLYVIGRASYRDNPRGRMIGDQDGMLKLIFRKADLRLLGVHVVGEQATELVHIGLMALMSDGGADLFNRVCFNYPTLGDLYKYATYDAMTQGMVANPAVSLPPTA